MATNVSNSKNLEEHSDWRRYRVTYSQLTEALYDRATALTNSCVARFVVESSNVEFLSIRGARSGARCGDLVQLRVIWVS